MNPTIRILIADDHAFYREGIRTLLDGRDGLEVVGEASDGLEVLAAIATLRPDVVLLDLNMPGVDGIATCHALARQAPETGIVIVTMFDDDDHVLDALRAGAHGYVIKDASREEVIRAIHAAHARQGILSPAIARRLPALLASRHDRSLPAGLTPREAEVLRLVGQGLRTEQVAERLAISPKTVRNNLSTIYTKIQVLDRAGAAEWARKNLSQHSGS